MTGWCPLQGVAALRCSGKIESITKQIEFPLADRNHTRHFLVGNIVPPCSLISKPVTQQQSGGGNGRSNYIPYEQQEQRDFALHSVAGSSGDPSIIAASPTSHPRHLHGSLLRNIYLYVFHLVPTETSMRLLSYPADSPLTHSMSNTRHTPRIPR